MQSTQCIRRMLKLPVAIGKHARISPRGLDFANKQVMHVLIVRLCNQAAVQPCRTALHQRRATMGRRQALHAMDSQLIGLLVGRVRAKGEG